MKLEPIVISAETHRGANAEYGRFLQGDILRLLPALIEQYEGQVKLIYMDPPFQTGDKFTMRVRVGEEDWRRGAARSRYLHSQIRSRARSITT